MDGGPGPPIMPGMIGGPGANQLDSGGQCNWLRQLSQQQCDLFVAHRESLIEVGLRLLLGKRSVA